MTVVPMQSFGIGDIIFCQTLVRAFGEKILWGVEKQFIEGLERAYPDIVWIDKNLLKIDYERRSEYTIDGMKILPLRWADVMLNVPYTECMKAKYMLYQLDWAIWKEHAMWKRDEDNEKHLQRILDIKNGEPYNVINKYFRSNSSGVASISVDNGLRNIEMTSITGLSLFDWSGIIENATQIHTVSTSIIYILEMLELKCAVDLYVRKPDEMDFRNIEYILQKHKYIYHL